MQLEVLLRSGEISMSLSKNLNYCKRCASISNLSARQFSSGGSNALDVKKMQAKTVILSQWKLVNHLKSYLAKISLDSKTFDSAINKEFAHFLQKIQPAIYGEHLTRYFDSVTFPAPVIKTETSAKVEEESRLSFPDVLSGLGIKIGSNKVEPEVKFTVPKWKETNKALITKESVNSRTHQILSLLTGTKSDSSKITKIEELNNHIKQYPDAKHHAVKEGAIRLLLSIKQKATNEEIQGSANEALALLGYAHPVPGKGIRILSIDGGGVRGVLVVEMLRKLEEFTGKPIHEMFDIICGVSTGAIISSLLGFQQKTLDEIAEIYKNLSTQIFTQSTLKGTSSLVWSHSYYDTALWERLLKNQIGEQTLISSSRNSKCPKLCALSAIVNQSRLSAYVFRNYSLPCRVQSQYLGSHEHLVWEAVRASAAAPTYFEEFKLGNMLHQDGGILNNNPTAVAIHEAKLLWPETPIQCVVSFGTGRTIPNPVDLDTQTLSNNYSSWKSKFFTIIESATDTESTHAMLNDLLPANVYYRFNPYLTEMLDIAEINPVKLEQLKRDAVMYLRRNEDKFQEAAMALSVEKGVTQKILDWVKLKSELHGLTNALRQ